MAIIFQKLQLAQICALTSVLYTLYLWEYSVLANESYNIGPTSLL